MKTIEILVGIPCSGKSTYAENIYSDEVFTMVVSRDDIRDSNKLHQYTKWSEDKVTQIFNNGVDGLLEYSYPDVNVILDNTHCKEKYIDQIIRKYESEVNIQIKFFDISLYKSLYRNILRWYRSGKYIPLNVIYNMYKNYNKINKKKYEKYLF